MYFKLQVRRSPTRAVKSTTQNDGEESKTSQDRKKPKPATNLTENWKSKGENKQKGPWGEKGISLERKSCVCHNTVGFSRGLAANVLSVLYDLRLFSSLLRRDPNRPCLGTFTLESVPSLTACPAWLSPRFSSWQLSWFESVLTYCLGYWADVSLVASLMFS